MSNIFRKKNTSNDTGVRITLTFLYSLPENTCIFVVFLSFRHSEDLIKKLEQAGLGYHVEAEKTTDKLGMLHYKIVNSEVEWRSLVVLYTCQNSLTYIEVCHYFMVEECKMSKEKYCQFYQQTHTRMFPTLTSNPGDERNCDF